MRKGLFYSTARKDNIWDNNPETKGNGKLYYISLPQIVWFTVAVPTRPGRTLGQSAGCRRDTGPTRRRQSWLGRTKNCKFVLGVLERGGVLKCVCVCVDKPEIITA